jgi:hypothetical protein
MTILPKTGINFLVKRIIVKFDIFNFSVFFIYQIPIYFRNFNSKIIISIN